MAKPKQTIESFKADVDKYATLETEIKSLTTKRDEKINAILEEYNPDIDACVAEQKAIHKRAKAFALKNREELFPEREGKTAETPLAEFSFRLSGEAVKTITGWTWDRVVSSLKNDKKAAYLLVTLSPHKEAIKDDMSAEDLVKYGMKIVQAEEFTITPKTRSI